jgi:hypothetical protein
MSNSHSPAPEASSDDDITKIGALADGFAASAINSTEVDDGSTGYVGGIANGDDRGNDNDVKTVNDNDNTTINDTDIKTDTDYDWSYDSKVVNDTDTDIKTTTITDTDVKTDYDWSYDSKTYTDNDTDIKTITDTDVKTVTDTDIKTVTETDTDIKTISDSNNSADSFTKVDTDFAVLEDVKDFGNLGIAGHDLTFNLGDDFSFTLDVDNILNGSLNGDGNDTGFSVVQANHLADQDVAYSISFDMSHAANNLNANAGDAYGAEGAEFDGKGWDLKAGDDVAASSVADASAILANSGLHMEFVQGANLLSNTVDSSVIGHDSHVTDVGEDS